MNINGRTVLITGGGSGIGLALAKAFSGRNNRVIVTGRDEERLEQARRNIPGMYVIPTDITDERQRRELVAEVERNHPSLSVLINNAGIAFFEDLLRDGNTWERVRMEIETNYLAPVRLVELLFPVLARQATAAIVNITSLAALVPMAVMPGYSASKAALHSYTLSLRRQMNGRSIRVFEVLPPPVDTAMVKGFDIPKMSADELAARVLEGMEKGREQIAPGSARLVLRMAGLFPRLVEARANEQLTHPPDDAG